MVMVVHKSYWVIEENIDKKVRKGKKKYEKNNLFLINNSINIRRYKYR